MRKTTFCFDHADGGMNMSASPLLNALEQHLALGRVPMHMPGHKGIASPLDRMGDLLRLDTTEIPDTDSRYEAAGPIAEAMERASALYGTKRTLFSAGGCSLCIQTMLRLAVPQGGKIVAGRTIHRSAVNAMALLDITPVWVLPRPDAGDGLPGRIYPQDIEAALTENPDACAVYVTTPDYYGVLCDLKGISAVCRAHGVPLLVDNAHGAHLKFAAPGAHPLERGASITCDSAHKTLPVMTGGAWLHIAEDAYCAEAPSAMALFGSTSPSYPIMVALDLCRAWLEEEGTAAFSRLKEQVEDVRRHALALGMTLPQGEWDPVRITIGTGPLGLTGHTAAELLRQQGVEPEYADGLHVVLIPSPFNPEKDYVRLKNALSALPGCRTPLPKAGTVTALPKVAASPRQALLAPGERIAIDDSVGRIAAEASCPCPPGVPVVAPGEIIDHEAAKILKSYGICEIKVIK